METLEKTYTIQAPAEKVFEALTDEKNIEAWSGAHATMQTNPPGEFSLWDGRISGHNKTVEPRKIVQDWKAENFQEFSQVTFTLNDSNGTTTLHLLHENIPDDEIRSIDKGWDEYYVGPLKEMVEK